MTENCKRYAKLLLDTKNSELVIDVMRNEIYNICTLYNYIIKVRSYIIRNVQELSYDYDEIVSAEIYKKLKEENLYEKNKELYDEIMKAVERFLYLPTEKKARMCKWEDSIFDDEFDDEDWEDEINDIVHKHKVYPEFLRNFYVPKDIADARKRKNRENYLKNNHKVPALMNRTDTMQPILQMQQILETPYKYCIQSLICALVLLCGRRPVELIKTGNFEEIPTFPDVDDDFENHDYELLFSGKAKSKANADKKYVIKTLVPNYHILKGVNVLRNRIPNAQNMSNEKINSVYSKGNKVKEYFNKDVTFIKLRGAYALLSAKMFREESKTMSITAWVCKMLCHDRMETANHYLCVNVDGVEFTDVDKIKQEDEEIFKKELDEFLKTI